MPSLELTSTLPVIFPLPASTCSPGHGLILESRTDAEWEARPGADARDATKLGLAGALAFIETGTSATHKAAVPEARVLQQVKESQDGLPITSDDGDNSIGCCPVPPDISMSLPSLSHRISITRLPCPCSRTDLALPTSSSSPTLDPTLICRCSTFTPCPYGIPTPHMREQVAGRFPESAHHDRDHHRRCTRALQQGVPLDEMRLD